MLKFLKNLFVKEENNKFDEDEEMRKQYFINHLNEHKNDSPLYEAMYIVFNVLDSELSLLIEKYKLNISFDYIEEDDYYEVMIEKIEKRINFYITIGRQGLDEMMILESEKEVLDINELSKDEILDKLKFEIVNYFN